ncbi:MAG: class I adenylate-forming enzyme family protein [Pseudomonadales bacterium]
MNRKEIIAQLTAPGQAYELVNVEQNGQSCRMYKNMPATLKDLYESGRSELPFIAYLDELLSYEEAWQQSCSIAAVLIERFDVKKGDRVAIAMRNYPEWITSFCAITSIGAIAVAVNSHWQGKELCYALNDSAAKVLIADQQRAELVVEHDDCPSSLSTLTVRSTNELNSRLTALEPLTQLHRCDEMPSCVLTPDDSATILYTSGSTGHPKGALSCHRSVLSALGSWELEFQIGIASKSIEKPILTEQASALLAIPLFHVTGSHSVFLMSFRAQRRLEIMYKWDAKLAAEMIDKNQITQFTATPAMTGDLVAAARAGGYKLDSLRLVGGGGAPRAPEQVRAIDETFSNTAVNTGWGMTETNAIGTFAGGKHYLEKPASSGASAAVLDLRIVNELGVELGTGERGELEVRGTSVIKNYWNRPDANEEAFHDGWFRSGDLAYIDSDGDVFIVDRIKDLVIRGGENIGCGAVEAAILEHPAVHEVAVYGVPDERLGEEVGASLYCLENMPAPDADSLREFLSTRLARYEIPRYLTFAPLPLPRTESGKIFKRQVKAEAAELLAG